MVRALGISSSNFMPTDGLFLLKEQDKRHKLLMAVDRINSKIGEWAIFPASIKLASKIRP